MAAKKSSGLPRKAPRSGTQWGQHFLRDEKILKKIAGFAQIKTNDVVLEVGPGKGSLTEFLLERAVKVIAIEKDRELVEFLKEKFQKEIANGKLKIIRGDILELKLGKSPVNEPSERDRRELEKFSGKILSVRENRSFFPATNYVLVGNIPYYITGAIFKKFLESDNPPKSITFVIQKEVASRIMAQDGKESVLSISIKAFGQPEYGGTIKAGSFAPAPKVDSAIISVRNINIERFLPAQAGKKVKIEKFFEVVKRGFSHKRKLLKSNLGVEDAPLCKCGIPVKARAENLSVQDWLCLTRNLI